MSSLQELLPMKRLLLIPLLVLLAAAPAGAALSVQIEGVDFDGETTVEKTPLALRGYGLLRYMVVIKAYVGALYLPEKVDSRNVLAPVPKKLELSYFHAIKAEDFARATRQKIADNVTPEELVRLRPRIEQLAEMYRDVQPGDRYALTFVPGRGTALLLNGAPLGAIEGEDFAAAVFAIWLGTDPIDPGFRDRLLGVS
jgi:hypothetical protein